MLSNLLGTSSPPKPIGNSIHYLNCYLRFGVCLTNRFAVALIFRFVPLLFPLSSPPARTCRTEFSSSLSSLLPDHWSTYNFDLSSLSLSLPISIWASALQLHLVSTLSPCALCDLLQKLLKARTGSRRLQINRLLLLQV